MGLPYGEEIMIVGRTMWTQSTSVTDRRTDGQSDGRTELRSQRPCNAEWVLRRFRCSPDVGSFGNYSFPYMAKTKSRLVRKLELRWAVPITDIILHIFKYLNYVSQASRGFVSYSSSFLLQ